MDVTANRAKKEVRRHVTCRWRKAWGDARASRRIGTGNLINEEVVSYVAFANVNLDLIQRRSVLSSVRVVHVSKAGLVRLDNRVRFAGVIGDDAGELELALGVGRCCGDRSSVGSNELNCDAFNRFLSDSVVVRVFLDRSSDGSKLLVSKVLLRLVLAGGKIHCLDGAVQIAVGAARHGTVNVGNVNEVRRVRLNETVRAHGQIVEHVKAVAVRFRYGHNRSGIVQESYGNSDNRNISAVVVVQVLPHEPANRSEDEVGGHAAQRRRSARY